MQFFTNLYFGSKLQKEVNNLSYKNVQYGRTRVRRNYASVQTNVELPNLIEIQTKSFAWFMDEGLRALFKEISPIKVMVMVKNLNYILWNTILKNQSIPLKRLNFIK